MAIPIIEVALGALFESLKLVNNQLGSKLERELLDILKREREGREELQKAESAQYPNYSDYAVKMAEFKIKTAMEDAEKFRDNLLGVLKPYIEAKK